MELRTSELTKSVLACLFAALISIGAYIAIPIPGTPVPIVLQNLFIVLAAYVLGPWWGLLSVAIYLAFGLMGIPVFSGGSAGLARFVGPTGGYLLGYIPATIVIGFAARKGKSPVLMFLAGLAGMLIVYAAGVLRLKSVLDIGLSKALVAGFYPFIPGDLLKLAIAAAIAPKLALGIEHLTDREYDG